jgi:hypothetical protein
MQSKLFLLAFTSLALPAAAVAQAKGAPPPPPMGAPASMPADPGRAGGTVNFANYDVANREGKTGDYLIGTVVVAGGTLPWDAIPVTVLCDGKTSYTSATDPKGHFVIAPSSPVATASPTIPVHPDGKPKLAAPFMNCTVQAALPGFNSTSVIVVNRNLQDSPDLGNITLTRAEASAGTAVSSTAAAAPKEAAKAFDKARAEWFDKKPDRAQKDLEKAVQIYPQFAEAWYQLGKMQEAANSPDAWTSFSKSAAADPQFNPPYEHLVPLAAKAAKWQEVADAAAHALLLNPRGTPDLWYFSALANFNLG